MEVHHPGCKHYVVVTEDDVIDVLSAETPEVEEVEPASPDDPLPGKSQILLHPEDRDKIEDLIQEVRNPNQPTDDS